MTRLSSSSVRKEKPCRTSHLKVPPGGSSRGLSIDEHSQPIDVIGTGTDLVQ